MILIKCALLTGAALACFAVPAAAAPQTTIAEPSTHMTLLPATHMTLVPAERLTAV